MYWKYQVLTISSDPAINESDFYEFPTCPVFFWTGANDLLYKKKNQLKIMQERLSAFCKAQKCQSRKNIAQCILPKETYWLFCPYRKQFLLQQIIS